MSLEMLSFPEFESQAEQRHSETENQPNSSIQQDKMNDFFETTSEQHDEKIALDETRMDPGLTQDDDDQNQKSGLENLEQIDERRPSVVIARRESVQSSSKSDNSRSTFDVEKGELAEPTEFNKPIEVETTINMENDEKVVDTMKSILDENDTTKNENDSPLITSETKINEWLMEDGENYVRKSPQSAGETRSPKESITVAKTRSMVNLSEFQSKRSDTHLKWFKQKQELIKHHRLSKTAEEEKKAKLKEEKLNQAKLVYESWKRLKDAQIKNKLKLEKELSLKKEKEEKEANEQKKQDTIKVYQAWKKEKGAQFKEKQQNLEDKKSKEDDLVKKKEVCRIIFEQWKKMKDDEIQKKLTKLKRESSNCEKEEQNLIEERRRLATIAYEQWIDIKDIQQEIQYRIEFEPEEANEKFQIPWLPPSLLIFDKKLFVQRRKRAVSAARCRVK